MHGKNSFGGGQLVIYNENPEMDIPGISVKKIIKWHIELNVQIQKS